MPASPSPSPARKPRVVLVMGVTGTGKSTVGQALSARLSARFLDADDFHPPANIAKMSRGEPLTDDDRWPWLDRLRAELDALVARREDAVLACSALKAAYRERLLTGLPASAWIVHLRGDAATLRARMGSRHHFMPASLLESQFATLEPPTGAIDVDVRHPVEVIVAQVLAAIGDAHASRPPATH